jgi:endoglucanase
MPLPSQAAHRAPTPALRALSALAPFTLAALVALGACSDAGSPVSPVTDHSSPTSPSASSPKTPMPAPNTLAGATFWVDPASNAQQTANAWRAARPADAALMDRVAAGASAQWIGNWNTNVQADVDAAASRISGTGALPVFVAYNIPQRDCGGLSGNSTTTADAYRSWVTAFANGIGARRAAVVLEPDALAAMDCLSPADQQVRVSLLRFAVETFASKGRVGGYLDAGHPGWISAATMAQRLTSAGVALAQGFSLNVSNFLATQDNVSYGSDISARVGGKHFVIDTGRNGLGPTADYQWCNPAGRALGNRPTTATGNALVDAYLWIKTPGESDGACNGAPAAGAWMPEYALGLAQRAS